MSAVSMIRVLPDASAGDLRFLQQALRKLRESSPRVGDLHLLVDLLQRDEKLALSASGDISDGEVWKVIVDRQIAWIASRQPQDRVRGRPKPKQWALAAPPWLGQAAFLAQLKQRDNEEETVAWIASVAQSGTESCDPRVLRAFYPQFSPGLQQPPKEGSSVVEVLILLRIWALEHGGSIPDDPRDALPEELRHALPESTMERVSNWAKSL